MRIVELILDEDQEISGIEAISIVENPAIEEDFVALKNQEIKLAEVDSEKRILLGALLIPNKPLRNRKISSSLIFCTPMATLSPAMSFNYPKALSAIFGFTRILCLAKKN